ncbi:hypothetical protein, partial [Klebsiella pneumoniae]
CLNPNLPGAWDDDPIGYGDPKAFAPKARRLKLWQVLFMVLLCATSMGASGFCGFRAVKVDHASDIVTAFLSQTQDLIALPADQIVTVVNEGDLQY